MAGAAPTELAEGLWSWPARHPDWHPGAFGAEVISFAVRTPEALLLIDPLLPDDDPDPVLELLDTEAAAAARIVIPITITYHVRSTEPLWERYRDRHEVSIRGHPATSRRLGAAAKAFTPMSPGEALPGGAVPHAIGKPRRYEQPLHLPSHDAVLFGDAVVGIDGGLRVWSDRRDRREGEALLPGALQPDARAPGRTRYRADADDPRGVPAAGRQRRPAGRDRRASLVPPAELDSARRQPSPGHETIPLVTDAAPNGSSYERMLFERPASGVLVARMNRPEKLNALDRTLFGEIARLGDDVGADPEIRACILTGEGRGFCAGADLEEVAQMGNFSVPEMFAFQEAGAGAVARLKRSEKPFIAAVNGPASGGGLALALACDIRIAAPAARFNVAFVRLGISGADLGVSWLLPRVVGLGNASEMMLTGRFVEASEAQRIGLVNAVVDADGLLGAALAKATEIARNSPFGLKLTKEALQLAMDAPSLEAAIALENRNQVLASRTEDMLEAVTAFLQKRDPDYRNR